MPQFVFISFDISSHAAEPDPTIQVERVQALNNIVRAVIDSPASVDTIWASGGDGGHTAFTLSGAATGVGGLLRDLRDWSVSDAVPLRIVAHVGIAVTVRGADDRIQLVGDAINLCGSLP